LHPEKIGASGKRCKFPQRHSVERANEAAATQWSLLLVFAAETGMLQSPSRQS